jgi:predicted ATPase/DNA-binding CsgD family transcriptional regulator
VGRQLASPGLVGRQGELAALEASLTAAAAARPSLTLVVGEAGLGKSRLTRELEHRAQASGAVVLHGECLELSGGEFPYAPIVGALRAGDRDAITTALTALPAAGGAEVARLVPELDAALGARPSETDPSRYAQARLYELLLATLGRLGDHAPVLFVVEDAHWADSATRDFLVYLVHNWARERLALVVTLRVDFHRSHPVRALRSELKRRETVSELVLARLGREDVERQLDAILGRPAERDLVDEVFRRSQGNPFYAEELVAARMSGQGDDLPEDVRDTLLLRAEALPEESLTVLRALAAVGRPASQRLLGEVAEVPEPALSRALRTAVGEHLVLKRPDDDSFEFRHALMREAMARDLMPGERIALHRRIAEVLLDAGDANAAELAFHWEAAEEWTPALTARVEAGLQAERVHAPAEARRHLESAVRLRTVVPLAAAPLAPDLADLLGRAAEAARLAGDCDAAVDLCRRALAEVEAEADPLRAAVLHERLGAYHFWDDDAALASYAEALRLLPEGRDAERARILSATALTLHDKLQWDDARQLAAEALRIAEAAGARAEQAHAHLTLGTALAFLGQGEAGEDHVRTAQAIAEALGGVEDRARVFSHLAEVLRLRGRIDQAFEVMEEGAATCARLGMSASFGRSMTVNAAEDLLWLGRWDEAERRLEETSRLEVREAAALLHRYVSGQLAVARGRFEDAREHLRQAREMCDESTAPDYLVGVHVGWAELALWEGRVDDALSEIAQALRAVDGREHPLYTPALFALGTRALADTRALVPRSDAERLREEAEGLGARLDALVARHPQGDAPAQATAHRWAFRGELARLRREPAPEHWARAAEEWGALAQPYPAAYARWRQAEALLNSRGRRAEAAASLELANAAARRLGAAPLLAATEALARASRLPSRARPPAEAAEPSTAQRLGLTPREMEVLPLVAEGLTNREIAATLFISVKTAGIHVSHILDKLNAENRAMAATIAHRLGLVEARVDSAERPGSPVST